MRWLREGCFPSCGEREHGRGALGCKERLHGYPEDFGQQDSIIYWMDVC